MKSMAINFRGDGQTRRSAPTTTAKDNQRRRPPAGLPVAWEARAVHRQSDTTNIGMNGDEVKGNQFQGGRADTQVCPYGLMGILV